MSNHGRVNRHRVLSKSSRNADRIIDIIDERRASLSIEESAESSRSYVYLLGCVGNDGKSCSPVKIGITDNPKLRIRGLQCASPVLIECMLTWSLPQRLLAQRIERLFIKRYLQHQIRKGEWFNVPPAEALDYVSKTYEKAIEMVKVMGVGNYQWMYDQIAIARRPGKRKSGISNVVLTAGLAAGKL
jgi:hypothetical protein